MGPKEQYGQASGYVIPMANGASEEMTPQEAETGDVVTSPAKVLRIGSMIKALLEEVRSAPLDESSRARLAEIYETSRKEIRSVLSDDLAGELDALSEPFPADTIPSEAELRIVQAQLVGWLEGLFHGIQATLFAQQMQAQAQLGEVRRRGLPGPGEEAQGHGNYL